MSSHNQIPPMKSHDARRLYNRQLAEEAATKLATETATARRRRERIRQLEQREQEAREKDARARKSRQSQERNRIEKIRTRKREEGQSSLDSFVIKKNQVDSTDGMNYLTTNPIKAISIPLEYKFVVGSLI